MTSRYFIKELDNLRKNNQMKVSNLFLGNTQPILKILTDISERFWSVKINFALEITPQKKHKEE